MAIDVIGEPAAKLAKLSDRDLARNIGLRLYRGEELRT